MINGFNQIPKEPSIDYLSDNVFQGIVSYDAAQVAEAFSKITGENYSKADVEAKFGSDTITDFDLYAFAESGTKDGFISKSEVLKFMGTPSDDDMMMGGDFAYLKDDTTTYSLQQVADKIAEVTGKTINPDDLSAFVEGRDYMTDFEMLMLIDQNKDGSVSTSELDDLIMNNNISYDYEDDTEETTSLYRGDGAWRYDDQEFIDKIEADFGITLSDDQVTHLFGDRPINDRRIENKIDMDQDGFISETELKSAFDIQDDMTSPDIDEFAYLSDDVFTYTPAEVADVVSSLTGQAITEADVNSLTGGKAEITDIDMFRLFDPNRDGIFTTDEANRLLDKGALNKAFYYLNDSQTSYSLGDLSAELASIGVDMTEDELYDMFGKETITDADILEMLDRKSELTGVSNGILDRRDFFNSTN